jgi:hypothetical protein
MRIFTIGTNGTTPVVLLSSLIEHEITHVFDIRRFPNMAFAQCTRKVLSFNLEKAREKGKPEYHHIPELAPSRKILNKGEDAYLKEIGDKGIEQAKQRCSDSKNPCFLSAEPLEKVAECHRHWLTKKLSEVIDGSNEIVHLEGRVAHKQAIQRTKLHNGIKYNLIRLFHVVNNEYFGGRYKAKHIAFAWELMPVRLRRNRLLGYFLYPELVVLSRVLDQEKIPEAVVKAVLYHEMLHLQLSHDGLAYGHTSEFYFEEARFREYANMFGFDFSNAWDLLMEGDKRNE